MSNRFPTNPVMAQRAGRALGLVRVRCGYSQAGAADAMGWAVDRLADVEAGRRNATWLEALDLLAAYGASLEELAAASSEAGESHPRPNGQEVEARS